MFPTRTVIGSFIHCCTKQTIYHTALLTPHQRATHYSVQPNLINICAARKMWHPCRPQCPHCLGQWGKKKIKLPSCSRLKLSSSPPSCILKHTAQSGFMPVMQAVNESESFDLRRDFTHAFLCGVARWGWGGGHTVSWASAGTLWLFSPQMVRCSPELFVAPRMKYYIWAKHGALAMCPTP